MIKGSELVVPAGRRSRPLKGPHESIEEGSRLSAFRDLRVQPKGWRWAHTPISQQDAP